MADPSRIVVAGDWHANRSWACAVIGMLPDLLPDESPRRIVHEDHDQLSAHLATCGQGVSITIAGRVHWLPRGYRWSWHGRTWLALGGATSVDRPIRTPGVDWWPEEAITYRQGVEVMAGGPADVMVTHDCPAGVPMALPKPPAWWEMEPAENHRDVLAGIVAEVRPRWLMHGHYHLAHNTTVAMAHGEMQVTGLAADGALAGNYRLLNVRTMEWETPGG